MPVHPATPTVNAPSLLPQFNVLPSSAATPTTPTQSTMPHSTTPSPMLPTTWLTTPMSPSMPTPQRSKVTCRNADNVPPQGTFLCPVPPSASIPPVSSCDTSLATYQQAYIYHVLEMLNEQM